MCQLAWRWKKKTKCIIIIMHYFLRNIFKKEPNPIFFTVERQKLLLLIWEIMFHILWGYFMSGPTAFPRLSLQTLLPPRQVASTWLKASSSQLPHRCLSIAIASNFFKLLTLSAAHVINPEVVAQVRLQNL